MLGWLRELALGLSTLWLAAELGGRPVRGAPALAVAALLGLFLERGLAIRFVPLTNKYEAFLGFAAVLLAVGVSRHAQMDRAGRALLAGLAAIFLGVTLFFDDAVHYPSPLLVTAWYPAHVPLSFCGYAFWIAAAGDAVDHLRGAIDANTLRQRQDDNLRWGLAAFSLAMIFGSIWGVVSWGAYFLWDAKILWSLASWVYFASFLHLRYLGVGARVRVLAALVGLLLVMGTYVGTSFMTGSIHAF